MALLLLAGCAATSHRQFPSDGSSTSPDAKWKIICKSPGNENVDAGHVLLLIDTDGRSRELRRFDRACDVLWSTDGSHIAVTDWLGSNLSDVLIYSVTNSAFVTSVGNAVPEGVLLKAESSGHCYVQAIKWLDEHRLQIRIFGHTDEAPLHGFDYAYVFDLLSARPESLTRTKPNR